MVCAGQDDIPICFAPGQCASSLSLDSVDVDTIADCLQTCLETADCEFFNFYITGEETNKCVVLANCAFYSTDSCEDCSVGKRTCAGKNFLDFPFFQMNICTFY